MSPIRIAADDPVDLVVAWRAGSTSQGRIVRISPDIQAQLRGIAVAVAATLTSGHPYSPDADLEDNTHLIAGRDQLLDVELLTTLERGPGLQEPSVEELTRRPLLCYAVLVGSEQSRRLFIRKRSPVSLLTKSIVARLFSGTLDQIEPPLFAFDANIDVIVDGDDVYILNKALFEGLFKVASTGTTRVKRVGRKINRRRPRYVRGSMGKTVRIGRVGPGGDYAGIHVGAQLRSRKRRTEYYVGVSAGRKISY